MAGGSSGGDISGFSTQAGSWASAPMLIMEHCRVHNRNTGLGLGQGRGGGGDGRRKGRRRSTKGLEESSPLEERG